jgi:hypothetical protein
MADMAKVINGHTADIQLYLPGLNGFKDLL